ncbi:hypothetical protein BaRGS_00000014 [Batillaria attramentaria]|uniref:Secreted protein n=1 Tax=Batillaria attramentaria TaxID=370345 RepID=A0ABD0M9C1_9CAEN
MLTVVFLLAVGTASLTNAFLFGQNKWNGLEVTFGVNPFDSNVFASLPRTESDASSDGWTKIGDCDTSSKFRGRRYVKDNDYAVILLFDVNGYIAGIQCGAAKSELPSDYPPATLRSIFQDDGDHMTLTAYFTDPNVICASGRSASQFSTEGTGSVLLIQNGSDPVRDSLRIPNEQSGADNPASGWTLGHCFPAMGVHYWYSITADMSCDYFFPVFVLYNEKKLTAFGWAIGAGLDSKRFEHPPHASVSAFMNPVPKCLDGYSQLSTMHIYMTAHPTQDLC